MNNHEAFCAQYSYFISLLKKESDRGCFIISLALIDEALEKCIRYRLAPSPERKDELLDNSGYAPLSTVAAKIDMAYRLGIISLQLRSSLHAVRRLRNDFAHLSEPIDFESQNVRDRVLHIFRLNEKTFDVIKTSISEDSRGAVQHKNGSTIHLRDIDDSKKGASYLLQLTGVRELFEIIVSIICAALNDGIYSIEQLKPPSM